MHACTLRGETQGGGGGETGGETGRRNRSGRDWAERRGGGGVEERPGEWKRDRGERQGETDRGRDRGRDRETGEETGGERQEERQGGGERDGRGGGGGRVVVVIHVRTECLRVELCCDWVLVLCFITGYVLQIGKTAE